MITVRDPNKWSDWWIVVSSDILMVKVRVDVGFLIANTLKGRGINAKRLPPPQAQRGGSIGQG